MVSSLLTKWSKVQAQVQVHYLVLLKQLDGEVIGRLSCPLVEQHLIGYSEHVREVPSVEFK